MGQAGMFMVRDYGAHGDGETLDIRAIKKAIDACTDHAYGGNFDIRGGPRGIFEHDIPGIYAQRVSNRTLQEFRLERSADLPDFYSEAFEFMDVEDLKTVEVETTGFKE